MQGNKSFVYNVFRRKTERQKIVGRWLDIQPPLRSKARRCNTSRREAMRQVRAIHHERLWRQRVSEQLTWLCRAAYAETARRQQAQAFPAHAPEQRQVVVQICLVWRNMAGG